MLRGAMHQRALLAVVMLVVAPACDKGESFEDEPNAPMLDESTGSWNDGPAPTPDPPLDAGTADDAGADAGTDAGSDAGADAGADAGGDAG